MTVVVSVIIPCYNEEKTIGLLLDALFRQTYPVAQMEVIISDGNSTDCTTQVITEFQAAHAEFSVRLVENPKRSIPAALNGGLAAATGEFVVRLDAHSVPAVDYIERCVAALAAELGDNVGGVWQIEPGAQTWMGRSIAVAAAHPLGAGDARYRISGQAGLVDTVPYGAFRRSLAQRIGGYDETLLANEDYEFNTRIRQQGGKIWLDPAIHLVYYARGNLGALERQYFRYGFWKWQMLRRYPGSLRWRQALPPVFVASVVGLVLLSIFWELARWLLGLELVFYLMILLVGGITSAQRRKDPVLTIGIPVAIAAMHFCWGAGFLVSMVKSRSTR